MISYCATVRYYIEIELSYAWTAACFTWSSSVILLRHGKLRSELGWSCCLLGNAKAGHLHTARAAELARYIACRFHRGILYLTPLQGLTRDTCLFVHRATRGNPFNTAPIACQQRGTHPLLYSSLRSILRLAADSDIRGCAVLVPASIESRLCIIVSSS